MFIKSPKNGFVNSIARSNGENVSLGDLLMILEDEDESQAFKRLKAGRDLAEVSSRTLKAEVIAYQRRMLQINIEIAERYVDFADTKFRFTDLSEQLGLNNPQAIALAQSRAGYQKASGELEKARIALLLFEESFLSANSKQSILEEQLQSEVSYLQSKLTRLTIKAPCNGKLSLLVASGSFCKCGDSLAEVT